MMEGYLYKCLHKCIGIYIYTLTYSKNLINDGRVDVQ